MPTLLPKVLDGTKDHTFRTHHEGDMACPVGLGGTIFEVRNAAGRIRWRVGQSLAVQPGRGKCGVARMTVTGLDYADVRKIDETMAIREGFTSRLDFWKTWTKMYDRIAYWMISEYEPKHFQSQTWTAVEVAAFDYLMMSNAAPYMAWGISFEVAR